MSSEYTLQSLADWERRRDDNLCAGRRLVGGHSIITARHMPDHMEHLTQRQLGNMLERGAISVSVEHRRQTFIAIAERAKRSKTHTPASRQRLRIFRAFLES